MVTIPYHHPIHARFDLGILEYVQMIHARILRKHTGSLLPTGNNCHGSMYHVCQYFPIMPSSLQHTTYSCIFFLTSSIQNINLTFLSIQHNLFTISYNKVNMACCIKVLAIPHLQSALVGSYSSTKSPYMYCNVKADLPTPPEPTMMTLCNGSDCFDFLAIVDGG